MSCSSGVTQEAQGRRWPRPLIPRRDVIIPTILRRPIVASQQDFRSAGCQSGRAWPGAQPSFNLAPDPASTIRLLIRAGLIAQLLEFSGICEGVDGGLMGPLPAHPERALRREGRSAVAPVGASTVPTTVPHTTCIIGTRMAHSAKQLSEAAQLPRPCSLQLQDGDDYEHTAQGGSY